MSFGLTNKLFSKKPSKTVKKQASKRTSTPRPANKKQSSSSQSALRGGAGYREYQGEALWLPSTSRPVWLDGSMPGDRGFDPLGLAKPAEYLQFDVDQLDQNRSQNVAGGIVGSFKPTVDEVTTQSLAPYSEVFGIQRFRECELIHGRWCMLATLGILVSEGVTGISWQQAGAAELAQTQYWGLNLPFDVTQISYIEGILMLGVEVLRNTERDPEKRCYPGGIFDPLDLAGGDDEKARNLKEAEIKHARLAMVAFFGFGTQALVTGKGALGSLSLYGATFQ